MNERDIAKVLYQYVVLGYSQKDVASNFGIRDSEVSNTVKDFNFNQVNTGAYQSGYDRGRYKNYKGIKVTEQMVYNFVCNENYNYFEDYLSDLHEDIVERQRQEQANKRREEQYRRQQAEEARQQRLREAEYRRQEAERRRREEQERLRQEAEGQRREEENRRKEEAERRRRQEQLDDEVHIKWMDAASNYLKEKNYEEALRYAEASYDLKPMLGNVYTIGKSSYLLGQYERAYEMCNILIEDGTYQLKTSRLIRARIYSELYKKSTSINLSPWNFIKDFIYLQENDVNIDKLLFTFAQVAIEYGNEEEQQKAIEAYEECAKKGIELKETHIFLANCYYDSEMWQEAIGSIHILESFYETNDDINYINYNADLRWRMGISYYMIGDLGSAYSVLDLGLPLDYSKPYPYSRECLPTIEEEQIFLEYLNELRRVGDHQKVRYYEEDLRDRKLFLNGKTTARRIYGDNLDGPNYRYVYDSYLDRWEQQIVDEENVASKLFNWIGDMINR